MTLVSSVKWLWVLRGISEGNGYKCMHLLELLCATATSPPIPLLWVALPAFEVKTS